MTSSAWSTLAVLGFVIATAAGLANSVYMQGTTGQSLGKRIVGTRLVSADRDRTVDVQPSSTPASVGALAAIWRTSSTSWSATLGFIRPLWQREHKTWADSIAKTVVLDRSASGFEIRERQPGENTTRNL